METTWKHDKFAEVEEYDEPMQNFVVTKAVSTSRKPAAVARKNVEPPKIVSAQIMITNLHPDVSDTDVKDLFGELGAIKSAGVNFNSEGKSNGTATVTYKAPDSAQTAIKKYNGVLLDGQPMSITLVGGTVVMPKPGVHDRLGGGARAPANGSRVAPVVHQRQPPARRVIHVAPVPVRSFAPRGGRGGRARGRGSGRGGSRGAARVEVTQADLDAQLDSIYS